MSFSCPRTASSTFGSVSRLIRNPSCFDCSSNATRKNRNSRSRTINNHTNSIKCSSTIVAVTDVRRKARDSKPDVENIPGRFDDATRSEEHTSELQSLMRISYAVFCLITKTTQSKSEQLQ